MDRFHPRNILSFLFCMQNREAETSALLFWEYIISVVTIPPYLSLYLWIVGRAQTEATAGP